MSSTGIDLASVDTYDSDALLPKLCADTVMTALQMLHWGAAFENVLNELLAQAKWCTMPPTSSIHMFQALACVKRSSRLCSREPRALASGTSEVVKNLPRRTPPTMS